jgi:hypothetical protein
MRVAYGSPVIPQNPIGRGIGTGLANGIWRLVVAALMLAIPCARAVTQVSNLGNTVAGPQFINFDFWSGTSFETDSSSPDFTLDSVQMLMGDANDLSGNFFAAIYTDVSGLPGTLVATLTGNTSPNTAGNYTYTPTGIVNLTADTTYWFVTGVSTGDGNYTWDYTTNAPTVQSWTIPNDYVFTINQGTNWVNGGVNPEMIAVAATPVPEPAVGTLLTGLGVALFMGCRRRLRGRNENRVAEPSASTAPPERQFLGVT